ncbi:MAG: dTDP-glucose 4,6-dehydratase [Myxococcota bacterium]
MTATTAPERAADSAGETWLVTGGAGFIGCNFVRSTLAEPGPKVVVYDALTYAGRRDNLAGWDSDPRFAFIRGDVADRRHLSAVLGEVRPDAIIHLAAESHVDRSIDGPAAFVQTNIVGTFTLLEAVRAYLHDVSAERCERFRLVHVSTDEVYGSAGPDQPPLDESAPYAPNSPYAASKAGADHLVRAAQVTYGVPAIITHASNNFGPYQFPEKLIPVIILSALAGRPIPIYGDGQNIRDWLSVDDHCAALRAVVRRGQPGQHYNIAGGNERSNLELARAVCAMVDQLAPGPQPAAELIHFVTDRPGHDRRYAISAAKIAAELDWSPRSTFDQALRATVQWYLDNRVWWQRIAAEGHRGQRIGLAGAPAQEASP